MRIITISIFCVCFFFTIGQAHADWPKQAVYTVEGEWKIEPSSDSKVKKCDEENNALAEASAKDIKVVQVNGKKAKVEKGGEFERIFESEITVVFEDALSLESDIGFVCFLGLRKNKSGELVIFFTRVYFEYRDNDLWKEIDMSCSTTLVASVKIAERR